MGTQIKESTLKLAIDRGFDGGIETTQSDLQKWLRDEKGITVYMNFKMNIKKWDVMSYPMKFNGYEYLKYLKEFRKLHNERKFDTYEDALENGLVEGLSLIE